MELHFKIKPTIVRARSKEGIDSKYYGKCLTFSSYGNYRLADYGGEECALVINYVKVNRKTKQLRFKNGKYKSSTVVREKEWIGYVYYFPISLLKVMNLEVKQKVNNFEIKKRKLK